MPTAAFYCPNFPFPPTSGVDRRCVDVVSALRQLGYRTAVLGSPFYHPGWNAKSSAVLEGRDVDDLFVHSPTRWELGWKRFFHKLSRVQGKNLDTQWIPSLDTPPGLRRWFSRTLDQLSPDVVVMTYGRYARLLQQEKFRDVRTIVDTNDLQTLNAKMWCALASRLPQQPIDPALVSNEVISEDFFEKLELKPDLQELEAFDRFDATISISPEEDDIIRNACQRTQVVYGPITIDPVVCQNTWAGPALFPAGPNPYNLQGYAYFARKVIPEVRKAVPDFLLRVTGSGSTRIVGVPGVQLAGFVHDLTAEYRVARMLICPVFGGTGQQVKIVEAMAHGVPVVAIGRAARGSPIVHQVNGFVATSPQEFAHCVIQLWQDEALRRKMGEAARQTVRESFSQKRMLQTLQQAIGIAQLSHS